MADEGGYDYQLVDPDINHDNTCPICHFIIKDAYQVNCCGNLMCEFCLKSNLKIRNECPLCREDITGKYFKDTRADRDINDLRVYCDGKKNGCSWKGELRKVEKHMTDCGYQEVECHDCEKMVVKKQLHEHMEHDCVYRKYKCVHCNIEDTYHFITTDHYKVCPEMKIQCLNDGCDVTVKRCEMASHVDKCPKQVVKCPFYFQGCDYTDKREKLVGHIQDNVAQHVVMIGQCVSRPVVPVTIKLDQFSLRKERNEDWYSNSFYTGPGGYRMRLNVYPNGNGGGKSTHVSVFINLMPGEYDCSLEFPFQGTVTIELLNQLKDANHFIYNLKLEEDTSPQSFSRQTAVNTSGYGNTKFFSQSSLGLKNNTCYLRDDALYFRVNIFVVSKTKPWLAMTM